VNWINYDRLVQHLETMPPAMFNYRKGFDPEEASCVDCQCRVLMGQTKLDYKRDAGSIAEYLVISSEDALEIWAPLSFGDPFPDQFLGPLAIQNALHRLRTVAAKYQRPEPAQPSTADREAQFLEDVRLIARTPAVAEP
jgi:hypothetical protein